MGEGTGSDARTLSTDQAGTCQRRGRFITFEGIDGSGKSTQAALLADRLRARGIPVKLTREPGGTPNAERLRRQITLGDAGCWLPEGEILLFMAARHDHVERLVAPALAAGMAVICDRFTDSTQVYQAAGDARLESLVDLLQTRIIRHNPDRTLLIDLAEGIARERRHARARTMSRFEHDAQQRRAHELYRALANQHAQRFRIISGQGTREEVAGSVWHAVQDLWP